MAAALPGSEPPREPVRLPRGFGSEVWLVDTNDGSRLVKLDAEPSEPECSLPA